LDSILKFENHPFEILEDGEILSGACTVETDVLAPASSCSDSGVSSDQQFSPVLDEVEEDDRGDFPSSLSSGSESSPLETSHVYSDQESSVQEDVEVDPSVFSIVDTSCFGEVEVEDNEAIISMSMLYIFKEVSIYC